MCLPVCLPTSDLQECGFARVVLSFQRLSRDLAINVLNVFACTVLFYETAIWGSVTIINRG